MKKQDPKFYDSYTEDFVTSSNQDCEDKDNYKWLNNNIFYKIISSPGIRSAGECTNH